MYQARGSFCFFARGWHGMTPRSSRGARGGRSVVSGFVGIVGREMAAIHQAFEWKIGLVGPATGSGRGSLLGKWEVPKSQVGSARLCACSRLRGAAAPTVSRARAGCRLSLRRTESQSVLSGGVGSPRGSEFHRGARPQGSVASIARGLARRDRALGRLRVEGSQGVRELSPSCSRILIESPSGMHGARSVRILPDDSARDAQDV